MSTFTNITEHEVLDLIAYGREKWAYQLNEAKVTIHAMWAFSSTDNGPAITINGYPALAYVKINSLRDRVQGCADAILVIDKMRWQQLAAPHQIALIHHELHHLLVDTNSDGFPKRDDHGRPKLKMRPHDFEIGGFWRIIEVHGEHAIEQRALQAAASRDRQSVFSFDRVDEELLKKMGATMDAMEASKPDSPPPPSLFDKPEPEPEAPPFDPVAEATAYLTDVAKLTPAELGHFAPHDLPAIAEEIKAIPGSREAYWDSWDDKVSAVLARWVPKQLAEVAPAEPKPAKLPKASKPKAAPKPKAPKTPSSKPKSKGKAKVG